MGAAPGLLIALHLQVVSGRDGEQRRDGTVPIPESFSEQNELDESALSSTSIQGKPQPLPDMGSPVLDLCFRFAACRSSVPSSPVLPLAS